MSLNSVCEVHGTLAGVKTSDSDRNANEALALGAGRKLPTAIAVFRVQGLG
jgi:hypothetical protein